MDLLLKPALSERGRDIVQIPKILLLYDEKGFVNSAMELMRIAARKVHAANSVCCASWDFDFVAEPLLMKFATREAGAADMVIVVLRSGDALPRPVKGWLRLWVLTHPWAFVGSVGTTWEPFDYAPASIDSQVEKIGELGNMDILAVGGHNKSALAALKNEMANALVNTIHQPLIVARSVSSRRAPGQKDSALTRLCLGRVLECAEIGKKNGDFTS